MASGGKRDFDDILVAIAERTKQDAETDKLGKALKILLNDIVSARVGNRHGIEHMGTLDMLRAWRQGQRPSTEVTNMKDALRQANMNRLISEVFQEADIEPDVEIKQNLPSPSTGDIYSKKISDSLTVLQCREKLENVCLNKLCKIKMKPWDPNDYATLKDMHTRVTMVTKDLRGRDTKKTETLYGSVAEIFSRKVNGQLPKRILLSAAAGRGKTTAVAKMAYDWTHKIQGSGLEQLPLLFVLKLRNTDQYTSIGEAIKSQLLSDVADITPETLETFIRANQDICHIIFDGLDEYAGISSGSNIVRVLRFEEYLGCRVLVTTRPHLENFFNEGDLPIVYTKMGIEGFSKDAITEYIDKFFNLNSDVSKRQGLKVYLESQPLISELVITPLFCLMVCHLWSDDKLSHDIGTQTKLFDSVNLFLLQHTNARLHSSVITGIEFETIISQLGKVALEGLLSDAKKLVFTSRDFCKIPTVLESACNLGIISKITVVPDHLPQSHDTTQTTIEFYHKLAQEHSAGKYLADKTNKYLVRIHMSKLDRVLRQIKGRIGDYENLIRFAAGTDNALCIIIMKAILTNESLDESERYRILLDCSSETTPGNEGNVSSMVERCVTSQKMVLKSPTVFTVVGMQNLPQQLKIQVGEVKLKDSVITADVTKGLWDCLGSFSNLETLNLTDSSISFPPSPPKLPRVTKLESVGVTSQTYERVVSSLPGLIEIDITIDGGKRHISQITAGLEQLTRITLNALPSSQIKGFSQRSAHGSLNYCENDGQDYQLKINDCLLSAETTDMMWSYFGSFTKLHHLIISDSSITFPPSPPELPHVTRLTAERMTSQSYEGLLSSLPGLRVIDIIIDDAERDISQITALLQRTAGEQLTHINLFAHESLPSEERMVSRETMRGLGLLIKEQTKNLQGLYMLELMCRDEEDFIDLVECCRHVKTMGRIKLWYCGTKEDSRLVSHLNAYPTARGGILVVVHHGDKPHIPHEYLISRAV